jgi:cation diffusion facilitator CzcD-associated flavoprotein CzcO
MSPNPKHTKLLIIGAGPFGLAVAAYARRHQIDHLVVGRVMDFWKHNMPKGMYLRSACDWHYDPFNEDTIERFLDLRKLTPAEVDPFPLDLYLEYCEWFRQQKGIEAIPATVRELSHSDNAAPLFEAVLDNGEKITAENVVLALGFSYFKNVPEPYPALFPPERLVHTCDFVDFTSLKGKRVLIIGGRQSAFEWAALIREHGASAVHLSYRHATPSFEPSDWSWVNPLVDSMPADPGWFRRLTAEEKEQVSRRMWGEGRLKLEPWLAVRINHDGVRLHSNSQVTTCRNSTEALEVELSNGEVLAIDQVVFATGYKVDVGRIPLLANGNILGRLEVRNGFPVLDEHFQSSIRGLFFTSMCATQDFGPFFAFTVSVRASAMLIGAALKGLSLRNNVLM